MTHPLDSLAGLDQFAAQAFAPGYPPNRRTLYAPIDDVHGALLWLLSQAQLSVTMAMYAFDDEALVNALLTLAGNGVALSIALDSSQAAGRYEAQLLTASALGQLDATVGTSERGAIMHLKEGVIDGTVRFSGSTNWSHSGEDLEDNELTVEIEPAVAQAATTRIEAIRAYQRAHATTG